MSTPRSMVLITVVFALAGCGAENVREVTGAGLGAGGVWRIVDG